MPTTLTLLLFTQFSLFPQDTAHWALYLANDGATSGTLFHASKDSMTTRQTVYQSIPNFSATQSHSLRSAVVVKAGSNLTTSIIDTQCRAAAQNRPFDLIKNNCQKFCSQVLVRLKNSGHITQAEFDALERKGFKPIIS
ncbi:hypothetical protein C8Q75DRAFT_614392 [Abortiporus biennis]|nr:hypothetical protein C8Q75DRAFT_614392 [Abortiporus biennis]